MTLEIEVTQKFIDTGYRQSCINCPVALAIVDKLQNPGITVMVSADYVGFYPVGHRHPDDRIGRTFLSTGVITWILDFDIYKYWECKPFKFILVIPDQLWQILERVKKNYRAPL